MNTLIGKSNSSAQISALLELIAGINKHFPKSAKLTLGSQVVTPAQLVATIQGLIDVLRVVVTTRADWHTAVQHKNAGAKSAKPLLLAFHQMLLAMFKDSNTLSDFGIEPHARHAPTVATKAEAVQKTIATRQTRGTVGSRQKLQVHGTVSTPVLAGPPSLNGAASTSATSTLAPKS
jgi:hypothetical protein